MGLDLVEFVMEVEDWFQITIPNEVAADLRTTADVVDYVHARVRDRAWTACPTMTAFHRLRRVLPRVAPRLRPSSRLEELFPEDTRRRRWQEVRDASGDLALPALHRAGRVVLLGAAFTVAAAIATGIAFANPWLGAALLLPFGVLAGTATRPLATRFPAIVDTTGDLARWTAARSLTPAGGWTRELVRCDVRSIVREQFGIRGDFSDDASFVEDFGVE